MTAHDTGLVEAVLGELEKQDFAIERGELEGENISFIFDRRMVRAALDAINASTTHVVVPVEPDWKMKAASRECDWPYPDIYGGISQNELDEAAEEIYKAMLTAAKEQP